MQNKNTLPPFYVGQRVVAIVSHSQGVFKSGEQFVIKHIRLDSCCGNWVVGIGITSHAKTSICPLCGNLDKKLIDMFLASRFAPIASDFQSISYTWKEVMENESSLINAN